MEALISWAGQRGRTVLEVAVGALAAQPGCASVIAGATSAEQVKANAAASDWIPSAEDLDDLDPIVRPPGGGGQRLATAARYSDRTARPNRGE